MGALVFPAPWLLEWLIKTYFCFYQGLGLCLWGDRAWAGSTPVPLGGGGSPRRGHLLFLYQPWEGTCTLVLVWPPRTLSPGAHHAGATLCTPGTNSPCA